MKYSLAQLLNKFPKLTQKHEGIRIELHSDFNTENAASRTHTNSHHFDWTPQSQLRLTQEKTLIGIKCSEKAF